MKYSSMYVFIGSKFSRYVFVPTRNSKMRVQNAFYMEVTS